jgi:hypothetical protein
MHSFTPDQICFGLNRDLDIRSFSCFLQLIGRREFADILADRLSSSEIEAFVSDFTGILKKHCTEDEYHDLFLFNDRAPQSGNGEKE